MAPKDVRDSPSTEGFTTSVREHFWRGHWASYRQPRAQRRSRRLPQRQCPFSTALSEHANSLGLRTNIGDVQCGQLGDPKAGADRNVQQSPIPDSRAGAWIWRIKQGLNLVLLEMGDQSRLGDLVGNRKNSANLVQCGRFTMLQKVEERSDCSQSDVAGSR